MYVNDIRLYDNLRVMLIYVKQFYSVNDWGVSMTIIKWSERDGVHPVEIVNLKDRLQVLL